MIFVLVHSPLLRPYSWSLVAETLRELGHTAVVPMLKDDSGVSNLPYWRQHASSTARALAPVAEGQPVVLVGHMLPVPEDWPEALCGYLLFSATYADEAAQARKRGWPVRQLEGGHFHQLVEPESVGRALVELARACGVP